MQISFAFDFATQIVQFLYFLNPKVPASSHLLCLYSSVCVGPVDFLMTLLSSGVQLLGSTAKNIAESCEISPSVTLKEKSTSPYFFRFQKFIFDFDHSDSLVRLFTAHD